ncbi:MAG: hypothetical protein L0228_06785 [Planctomycetes bacterium]|nr:hypothetical protein [Planctomycetota bacterium]
MERARQIHRWLPWTIAYSVLIVGVVLAMLKTRDWTVSQLASPKSVADWQAWREEVRQQHDRPGPVQRRVPKSSEPPALVMMRDHFAVSLVGAALFSSALYWVFVWFVSGVISRS